MLERAVDILQAGHDVMSNESGHLPDRPGGDAQGARVSSEQARHQRERLQRASEKFSDDARKETSSRGRVGKAA